MPSRRRTSPSASPSGAGSRPSRCSGHVDERDLAAEAAHRLRHLDADRPAAEDQQAARNGLHAGRLAIGPDAIELAQARDRRHDRIGAAGQDDVVGGVTHAVDVDHPGAGEPAAAAQQVDAVVGQPALLSGVRVVRDHEVTPRERRLDVDLGARRCIARRPPQPHRGAAGSSRGCTRSRSTRPPPARARRARPAARLRQAHRRSARPAGRRRSRSRRSPGSSCRPRSGQLLRAVHPDPPLMTLLPDRVRDSLCVSNGFILVGVPPTGN